MVPFLKDSAGLNGESAQGRDTPRSYGECSFIFDVKDLHNRNTLLTCAMDERLQPRQEQRQILVASIGTLAEGFLYVNNDQCCVRSGHWQISFIEWYELPFRSILGGLWMRHKTVTRQRADKNRHNYSSNSQK
jgi:hypothetical protein